MDSKIKFGFSKTIKKPNLVNKIGSSIQKHSNVELIEEIEGSSIKITGKNPEDEVEKKLIIPMTDNQKTTPLSKLMEERLLRAKNRKIKTENTNGTKSEIAIKQEPMEIVEESIEQQAARELMEDLIKKEEKPEIKIFEVPMNPDDLPLDGAKESSLDDYDRVPIGDFGKAMLRGMGWKEEEESKDKKGDLEGPTLRPKGMGLGADKVIKKQPLLVAPNQSEVLEIKRNACVKILAGKHKNFYGTIEGFDDGGGRIVIKLAIGGLKVTLNEFMAQPVSKKEFAQYGKVLNSTKFEEYKSGDVSNNQPKSSEIIVKKEIEDKKPRRSRSRERQRRDRSDSRNKRTSHKSTERRSDRYDNTSSSRKYHGRSRSREKRSKRRSSSSDYKKKSSKHRSHRNDFSSPDSRHSSENEKKHKKKTKKSKHKRDRS